MYPSIAFRVVKKAISSYARNLKEECKLVIINCLKMIKFSMSNQLFVFLNKFYKYGQNNKPDERPLTIGGYESAWLADLVVSFIIDNLQEFFIATRYHGIYRDDGIVFFDGKWNNEELTKWLEDFQTKVNEICETDKIVFTLHIWNPNNKIELTSELVTRVVSISRSKYLPYLDTVIFWNKDNNLQFVVHKKKDQKLKYLNEGSSHPNSCFCAIPYRVFLRLCKLTLQTKMNLRKTIDDLYLDHASALCKANLVQGNFPTMEELWNEVEKRRKRTNKEVELNEDIN